MKELDWIGTFLALIAILNPSPDDDRKWTLVDEKRLAASTCWLPVSMNRKIDYSDFLALQEETRMERKFI